MPTYTRLDLGDGDWAYTCDSCGAHICNKAETDVIHCETCAIFAAPKRSPKKLPNDPLRLNRVEMIKQNRRKTSRLFRLRDGREVWLPNIEVHVIGDRNEDGTYDIGAPRWLLEDRGILEYD